MRALAKPTLFMISIVLLGSIARAEFRVFRLSITDDKNGKSREVVTTLDPDQYRGYHHINIDERVEMVNSWMCWKRNDYTGSLCPDPEGAQGTAPTAGSTLGAGAPR